MTGDGTTDDLGEKEGNGSRFKTFVCINAQLRPQELQRDAPRRRRLRAGADGAVHEWPQGRGDWDRDDDQQGRLQA